MQEINRIIQEKADKCSELIQKTLSVSSDLEPRNVSINIESIPCEVDEDGGFLVLTGTKDKPYGIGLKNPPEMVLLYNKKGGMLVPTSFIRDIIKEHRSELTPEIDSTYSIMGVRLNLGVISSWIGEEFLTVLHQSSLHDS